MALNMGRGDGADREGHKVPLEVCVSEAKLESATGKEPVCCSACTNCIVAGLESLDSVHVCV